MAYIDPRYLEHQRKRFMRHDAHRYIRHDVERFFRPGCCPEELNPHYRRSWADRQREVEASARASEIAVEAAAKERPALEQERRAIEWNMAALRLQRAWLQLGLQQRKAYNPNQPRVPTGQREGGQWTSDGGLTEFGGARKRPVGGFGQDVLNWTVRQFVSRRCKGHINRELPGQFEDTTIADLLQIARGGDAAARKCEKLLREPRFRKGG